MKINIDLLSPADLADTTWLHLETLFLLSKFVIANEWQTETEGACKLKLIYSKIYKLWILDLKMAKDVLL